MDYLSTSATSVFLRLLLSRLSPDSPRTSLIQTGITGLWEGVVLHQLSNDVPQSFVPYLKYVTTLWLGHVVGEDTKFELFLTCLWSVVGAMLAEAVGEIYAYDTSRRHRRRSSSSQAPDAYDYPLRDRTISNSSESISTGTRRVAFSPIITTVEPPGVFIEHPSSSGPLATSSPRLGWAQMERTASLDSAVMSLTSPPLVPAVPLAITLGPDSAFPTSPASTKSPDVVSPTGVPLYVRMAPPKPVSILRTTPRPSIPEPGLQPGPSMPLSTVVPVSPPVMAMPVPVPPPPPIAMPVPVPAPARPFLMPETIQPIVDKDTKDKGRQTIKLLRVQTVLTQTLPADQLQSRGQGSPPPTVVPTSSKSKASSKASQPIPVPPPPVISQTLPRPRPISSSSLLMSNTPPPGALEEYPLGSRPTSSAPPAYNAADRASMISNFSIDSVGNISTISAVGKEALLKRAQLYRDQARDQESEREKALRRQREAKRRKKLGEAFLEGMTARKAGKSALGLHGKAERRYWLAHNDNTATTSSRLPTVDVHGLLKAEAIRKTEDALCDAILTSQRQLRVIVGKGNHSKGGLPVLKPAIKSEMESQGLVVSVDPTNDGVLVLTWPT